MRAPAVYCFDTNCFIQGRNHRYPPDVFPGLWENIEHLIALGRLCASDEVKYELDRVDDDLSRWARTQSGLFVPVDEAQTDEVTRILDEFEDLVDYRASKSGADPFVVALAKARGFVVVTQERMAGKGERSRIPNVCDRFGVSFVDLLGLFRLEGWRFYTS